MSNNILVNIGDDNIHHSIMRDNLNTILSQHRLLRQQSVAEDMLQKANLLLEAAERRLAEQEEKIRQLESLACTDPLTGVLNRRGFEKFLMQESERIRRYKAADSLMVLIDLDGFKFINDNYGHAAGDACLRKVGEYLMSCARLSDGVARLGGDEFAMLLTQMSLDKSATRLHEIRYALNNMQVEWEGMTLAFSASIGVEPMRGDSDCNVVLDKADRKLYEDKKYKKYQSLARLNFPEIM